MAQLRGWLERESDAVAALRAGAAPESAFSSFAPVRIVVSNRWLRFAAIDGQLAAVTAGQRYVRARDELRRRYESLSGWTYSLCMTDEGGDSAIAWALETALLWELHRAFGKHGLRIAEIVPAFVAGFDVWRALEGRGEGACDGLHALYEAGHLTLAVRRDGRWQAVKVFGALMWWQLGTILQWEALDAGPPTLPVYLMAPGHAGTPPPRMLCMPLAEGAHAAEVFARWAAAK